MANGKQRGPSNYTLTALWAFDEARLRGSREDNVIVFFDGTS
jgi:hypothetical protein